MSIELDTALAKLARALDVERTEVEFLDHLDLGDLRDLQWKVIDQLQEADAERLGGVVAASKLLPVGLAASIGEKWFGPILCAKLVGLIEPARARHYARNLGVDFMADIATRTDPRVVRDLVRELDLKVMQRIATTLLKRDDHLTLSHFVGHIPPEVVASVLEAFEDNAAVVRIARYVDDLHHLDPIVALLPDDRILALVAAVDAEDLWVDGLHLFSHLGDEQIARIAVTIIRQDHAAVRAALEAFERHNLWDQGLQLVAHLDEHDIVSFADVLLDVPDDLVSAALDDSVVTAAVEAIDRNEAWDVLVRIALAATDLSDQVRARLRSIVDSLPAEQVARFEQASTEAGHPDLLASVLG